MPFNCVLGRFLTSNKHTDEKHVPSKAGLKCQDTVRGRNKAVYSKRNSYFILMVNCILFCSKLSFLNMAKIDFLFFLCRWLFLLFCLNFGPNFVSFEAIWLVTTFYLPWREKREKRCKRRQEKQKRNGSQSFRWQLMKCIKTLSGANIREFKYPFLSLIQSYRNLFVRVQVLHATQS